MGLLHPGLLPAHRAGDGPQVSHGKAVRARGLGGGRGAPGAVTTSASAESDEVFSAGDRHVRRAAVHGQVRGGLLDLGEEVEQLAAARSRLLR